MASSDYRESADGGPATCVGSAARFDSTAEIAEERRDRGALSVLCAFSACSAVSLHDACGVA